MIFIKAKQKMSSLKSVVWTWPSSEWLIAKLIFWSFEMVETFEINCFFPFFFCSHFDGDDCHSPEKTRKNVWIISIQWTQPNDLWTKKKQRKNKIFAIFQHIFFCWKVGYGFRCISTREKIVQMKILNQFEWHNIDWWQAFNQNNENLLLSNKQKITLKPLE